MTDAEQMEILSNFVERLVSNTKQLEPDLAAALNEHFWEWYEPIDK
jgi:plasmid maintenance system antidote protein VapI